MSIFLGIIELKGQDAENICKCLLGCLKKSNITHEYLTRHFVAFTNDGSSTTIETVKGNAVKLKVKYPQIVTWHCLNHRLELAVSDTMKSVEGCHQLSHFLPKSMLCT